MQSSQWVKQAIQKIKVELHRSADTYLFKLDIPSISNITVYLKDESAHPTGSLKHRLAISLFLYGLCNGWIREKTTIIEASSGSTAVSEAYFAKLLGLPFIAVMPKTISPEKIAAIEFYGGQCHLVDNPSEIYSEAKRLAEETQGHFMDQFTYAERATDWRGNNNIAESIFKQMKHEEHPVPNWIVCGGGTGGTAATIGRYIRYNNMQTQLCVVDPENSVFYDFYHSGDKGLTLEKGSCIEGIGRPRVEPSFIPGIIEHMIKVPDAASIATMRWISNMIGRRCGGSTGTNMYAVLQLINDMQKQGQSGSIVSLICDGGERYQGTYYNDGWVKQQGYDLSVYNQQIAQFVNQGEWVDRS